LRDTANRLTSQPEKISDISLLWERTSIRRAIPILKLLSELHALNAVGGRLYLVPVDMNETRDKALTVKLPNVLVVEPNSPEIRSVLSNSAALVAPIELAD